MIRSRRLGGATIFARDSVTRSSFWIPFAAGAALFLTLSRIGNWSNADCRIPILTNWNGGGPVDTAVPAAPPVLVLTPVRNSNPRRAARYLRNLAALEYDHGALHVALLADAASARVFRKAIDAHARDPGPRGAFASLRVFEEPPAMAARNRDQRERVRPSRFRRALFFDWTHGFFTAHCY